MPLTFKAMTDCLTEAQNKCPQDRIEVPVHQLECIIVFHMVWQVICMIPTSFTVQALRCRILHSHLKSDVCKNVQDSQRHNHEKLKRANWRKIIILVGEIKRDLDNGINVVKKLMQHIQWQKFCDSWWILKMILPLRFMIIN